MDKSKFLKKRLNEIDYDFDYLEKVFYWFTDMKKHTYNVKCKKCHKKLKAHGALIFSPPNAFIADICKQRLKFRICMDCYLKLCDWLHKKD